MKNPRDRSAQKDEFARILASDGWTVRVRDDLDWKDYWCASEVWEIRHPGGPVAPCFLVFRYDPQTLEEREIISLSVYVGKTEAGSWYFGRGKWRSMKADIRNLVARLLAESSH